MVSSDDFQLLKNQVLSKKPILREILNKHGAKSLYDYVKGYISVNLNPPIKSRQRELIGTVKEEVARLLGNKVAVSVSKQLKKYYYVSTADHHGPICHPFFLTSNLISAAPYLEQGDDSLRNVLVFACSNTSLDNSSFPRGLIFNSLHDNKINLHRLPFFSDSKTEGRPVFNFPGYGVEQIKNLKKTLAVKIAKGLLDSATSKKIETVLDEVYLDPGVLACANYADQITKTNFKLWQKFSQVMEVKNFPNLIYLELENLVIKLLIKHHLFENTTIHRMLFDSTLSKYILDYFEGIQGAFSIKEKWGTYLFWALPQGSKYRLQLFKKGNFLESNDGSYKVELTPDSIKEALEKNELIPGLMLVFVLLTFYYGLKCLGGFSQVNYVTFMKRAYIKMQADRGKFKSIEVCARVQTKELGGDFTLIFLADLFGNLMPATGLDLLLYGNGQTWPIILSESKNISLEEAINPLLPEFYRIVYPDGQRDENLMKITAEDIIKYTGVEQKLKACVSL